MIVIFNFCKFVYNSERKKTQLSLIFIQLTMLIFKINLMNGMN